MSAILLNVTPLGRCRGDRRETCALICHVNARNALTQSIHGARAPVTPQTVLPQTSNRPDVVMTFGQLSEQFGISSGGFCKSASSVMT